MIMATACPVLKRMIDEEFCKNLCECSYGKECMFKAKDLSKPTEFKGKHEDVVVDVVDFGAC